MDQNLKKKVREKTWNTWNTWIMWVNSLISKHFSALKDVDQTWINVKQDVEHGAAHSRPILSASAYIVTTVT